LQMLEASRNANCHGGIYADTIEFTIFLDEGITFDRVLQSIIEVFQVQLNTCFEVNNNRIHVLESIIESCLTIRVLQSIIESRCTVNDRILITRKHRF